MPQVAGKQFTEITPLPPGNRSSLRPKPPLPGNAHGLRVLALHRLDEPPLLYAVPIFKPHAIPVFQAFFSGHIPVYGDHVGVGTERAHFIDQGILEGGVVGMQDVPVGKGDEAVILFYDPDTV